MNTRKMVLTAVLSAVAFLFLFASAVVPSGSAAMLALSCAVLCVAVIECGARYALIGAAVVSILGILFIPNKAVMFPYVLFFGYYPVLKLYIERIGRLAAEWAAKISVFLIAMAIAYLAAGFFINTKIISSSLPVYLLIPAAAAVFAAYDYALSLFIGFYKERMSGIKKDRGRK